MAVINGQGGAVNGADTVRDWSCSIPDDAQAIIASNTKGGTVRIAGNDDWSGSYNAYGHTPASFPGDAIVWRGAITETKGLEGTAICDSIEISWDIEGGGVIGHTVNFSGNGVLTNGTITSTTDTSVPDMPPSEGTKAQLVSPPVVAPADGVYVDVPDVRTMTLTISAANSAYVSSSTSGGVRRVAGNIDFTVAINVYTDDFAAAALPASGDITHLRLFVDGSAHWDLDWVLWDEISDCEVDIENNAPVACTLNGKMCGFTDIASTVVEGIIADPTPTTKWPV